MSWSINDFSPVQSVIVWFDGVNRVWKWTQAELLKNFLESKWIKSAILRWDGSREWLWRDIIADPTSLWRQKMRPILKNLSGSTYDEKARDEAARRLNRELSYFIYKYSNTSFVPILDRTIFSRRVTKSQHTQNSSFESLLSFYNGKHQGNPSNKKDTILPDVLFLLRGETSYLLDRLEKSFDGDVSQYQFRRHIILKYNDFFNRKIDELPVELRNKTIVIDASLSIDHIKSIVQNNVMNLLCQKWIK